ARGRTHSRPAPPRRPTVVGIRTVCPAGGAQHEPHEGLPPRPTQTSPGPRPAPPPALPRKKGTVPHAPPRTFDRRPLRAPLPARSGRNGNRVACLGPLPTP